jgi:ComF family protein
VFNPFPPKLRLETLFLDSVSAPLELTGSIPHLIHNLKYQHEKGLATFLGQLLVYTATYPKVDIITAVPLHPSRQRQRGYNQAEEMAITIAKLLNIPYRPLLRKSKPTATQATAANRTTRLKQLTNVFQSRPSDQPIPKKVLLIDDVITTGSTMNECAKVLKEQGVIEVHGLAAAHGG